MRAECELQECLCHLSHFARTALRHADMLVIGKWFILSSVWQYWPTLYIALVPIQASGVLNGSRFIFG